MRSKTKRGRADFGGKTFLDEYADTRSYVDPPSVDVSTRKVNFDARGQSNNLQNVVCTALTGSFISRDFPLPSVARAR